MEPISIPLEVSDWVRQVFRDCNERISEKLSNNPNAPEESFDLTLIEHLSRYSSPKKFDRSSWAVRIVTHYLGGMRHFSGWEIVDIGLLVFFRRGGQVIRNKVVLLQSKRLYPTNNVVCEDDPVDYQIGFGRLADPEDVKVSLTSATEFSFDMTSSYGALLAGDPQVKAIDAFQAKSELAVYYQFYNPWRVPFKQRIPLDVYRKPSGELSLGTRIIPAPAVHRILAPQRPRWKPSLKSLADACGNEEHRFGWRLEYFIADLLLQCHEGTLLQDPGEPPIHDLFYRRTGPI
jgi:hypothetical protein